MQSFQSNAVDLPVWLEPQAPLFCGPEIPVFRIHGAGFITSERASSGGRRLLSRNPQPALPPHHPTILTKRKVGKSAHPGLKLEVCPILQFVSGLDEKSQSS